MSQSSEKHGKLRLRIKSLMHFATRHPLSFLCLAAHKPACFLQTNDRSVIKQIAQGWLSLSHVLHHQSFLYFQHAIFWLCFQVTVSCQYQSIGRSSRKERGCLSFYALQSGVWSQLWPITHPCLKAQVYVVCNKIKLVGVLFNKSLMSHYW